MAATLFSLAHGLPSVIVPIFVLGWLLCAVYERRGSIYDAILFHALFNGANLLIVALESSLTTAGAGCC